MLLQASWAHTGWAGAEPGPELPEQSLALNFQNTNKYTVGTHMLDQRLHDLVAVRHVRYHVRHVVFRCPNQRWPKDQSQVPGLHLGWEGKIPEFIALSMTSSTLRPRPLRTPDSPTLLCPCIRGRASHMGMERLLSRVKADV